MNERLLDLLLQRAVHGLGADEARELAALLASANPAEVADIEATVALVQDAMDASDPQREPLPTALRERIVTSAAALPHPDVIAKLRRRAALGWLAAAAALALAGIAWFVAKPTQIRPTTIDAARDRVTAALAANDPSVGQASGQVVWSDDLQHGYVRLRGLAPNDPKLTQYQMWIIDEARDKNPVSAGVFDVVASPDGEAVITFHSDLPVSKPGAFAITSEQPGGVVVTDGPILFLGKPN